MPTDACILSRHLVFKIKKTEQGERRIKSRLGVHGNSNDQRDDVRKDSMEADMFITRLVIYLGIIMGFECGVPDIKGAFMQSGSGQRAIYIIPPGYQRGGKQVYWNLL